MKRSKAFRISGIVKKHLGRGRELGFPTANLGTAVENLSGGVYIGFAKIFPEQDRRTALIFIGAAKTFGEKERRVEVHILDFNGDLYGQKIEVELLKKIRNNQKFKSKEELIVQMRKDERLAKNYFKACQF